MTIDEMIAVLQAAKAGKPAEQMGIDGKWRHVDIAHMTSYAPRLRIKPEPREWTLLCNGYDKAKWIVVPPDHTHSCPGEKVKVREVLE